MSEFPDAPDQFESADWFLDASALRHLVLYCLAHIYNLESQGQFPRAIHLGPGRSYGLDAREGRRADR